MRRFLVTMIFLTATLAASLSQGFAMTGAAEDARSGAMAPMTAHHIVTRASDTHCPPDKDSQQPCGHHCGGSRCLACSAAALPPPWSPRIDAGAGVRVKALILTDSLNSVGCRVDPPVPRSSLSRLSG